MRYLSKYKAYGDLYSRKRLLIRVLSGASFQLLRATAQSFKLTTKLRPNREQKYCAMERREKIYFYCISEHKTDAFFGVNAMTKEWTYSKSTKLRKKRQRRAWQVRQSSVASASWLQIRVTGIKSTTTVSRTIASFICSWETKRRKKKKK